MVISQFAKVQNCKFLRVEIDSALKWKNHIRQVEFKLSSAIFVIRNIRYKINRSTALKLYDTFILSHLTYLQNLYRLQKRALRLCFGENKLSSDLLFDRTNRLSLFNIHNLLTMKLIFHFFHDIITLPTPIASLFNKTSDIHGIHTRSSDNLSLHTHFGRWHTRVNSVKIAGPVLWNRIPTSLRQISSLPL